MERADPDALLRDAERRSERLIAVVRIVVSLALAFVFNLALSGALPPDNAMLARQSLLARGMLLSYGLVGIASFVLSAPRWHRRWFAYLFIAVDVAFLAVGLELGLANTGLPPSLVAALPTVWLAPLILAFGAMRYSVVQQATAGALLAVALAWLARPREGGPVEPLVALYFFAGPPNVMRIAILGVTAALLLVAVARVRGLLREALEQERRRLSLTKYLPPKVARLIEQRAAEDLRAGRRQAVVVMFVDVRGFTAMAEGAAPETVSAFLARYRGELRAACEARGGVIDKFIGDGAMIVFGLPEPNRGDAAAALAGARDVLRRIARWSLERVAAGAGPVRVGIGVHRGEAFVGAVGDAERLEFTVVGDTVNVAARVEEATKTLSVDLAATQAVLAAAGEGAPRWRPLPPLALRGRTAPVHLSAWVGESAAPRDG